MGARQGVTLESRVSLQERENDVCNYDEGSLLHGASDTTSLFPLIPCSLEQSVLSWSSEISTVSNFSTGHC